MSATPHPQVENELPKTRYSSENFWLIALVIVVGNLAGTIGAADQLCKIPLQHLLKDTLRTSREDMAKFFFLAGLFFYLKPIAGILTDAFPIFGTRRRYYLLFSSIFAAAAWIVLGFIPKTYSSLLLGVIFVDLFVMMISTVAGAFLVEVGQSRGEVGKLSAIRQVARSVVFTVQAPIGGLLAGMAFWIATGCGALVVLSIFPIAFYFVKEKANPKRRPAVFSNAEKQLKTIVRSWPFWLATLFVGLYYFAPGFSTMAFFRQSDVLHMDTKTIGRLVAAGNVAGIAASFIYLYFARRIPIRLSLTIGVVTSALSTFLYLFYNSQPLAYAIDFQNGFFAGYVQVALLDLAARGSPAGCEGLAYAFIMSIMNLSSTGSDWLGAHLADTYHLSWNSMVLLNGGSTFIVLLLLPFMPKAMMSGKDNASPNLENTGEPEET